MIPKPEEVPAVALEITRRDFIKAGGALFVSIALRDARGAGLADPSPTAEEPIALWIELRGEDAVTVRTGRTEIGTGMTGFYTQVAAEELCVRPEAITLVTGDTDRTSEGGYSAGFLNGAVNLRKAAAYTREALLRLAASQLGVSPAVLSVENGVVSAGAKRISYSDLVRGRQLDLKIPVTGKPAQWAREGVANIAGLDWAGMDGLVVAGNPPLKPISQYKVVGTSFPMPVIPDKVRGKTQWSCDVMLPGMLHARVVRPPTLGSTLISPGTVDKKQYPAAEVVHRGNLVAVVSPNEWEALSAVRSVATHSKWSEWAGLPGSDQLTATLRAQRWGAPDQSRGPAVETHAALAKAEHTLAAAYEQPYVKHAPIGPYVAVADVHSDRVTVWTHSAHPQALRARLANLLGIAPDKVVVRCPRARRAVWPVDVRGRRRRGRCGNSLAGHGKAGARAMEPAGRLWLVSRFARLGRRYPGSVERGRQSDGCPQLVLFPAHDGSAAIGGAPCRDAGGYSQTGWLFGDRVALRSHCESPGGGLRARESGRILTLRRTAGYYHAHPWSAAAKLRSRVDDERGCGDDEDRCDSVPAGAHDACAVDRCA